MKVIFCTYDDKLVINGINTWLLNLLPALKTKGFDVGVIYYSWPPENKCATIPLLKNLGIDCYRISSKRYLEKEVGWILNQVKVLKPDIFVSNHILQAWYATPWIEKAGIPTIGVIHNDDLEYQLLTKSFLSNNDNRMSACVAVSSKLHEHLKNNFTGLNIKQIPCSTPLFKQKAKFEKEKPFNILYVGRLVNTQKNIGLVVRTLEKATAKLTNVEAYIYGSGPDYNEVLEIVRRATKTNKIHIKGIVPNEIIRADLLNAHVIILMSDYEGLPVAIMEAMAAGVVPICKITQSGLSELIIDKTTGLLIEDTEDFVDQVQFLLNEPKEWERLSINAKNHIEINFSTEKMISAWINLFQEIKSKKKHKLKIPYKIKLPKNDINLLLGENREPSFFKKLSNKLNRMYKNV